MPSSRRAPPGLAGAASGEAEIDAQEAERWLPAEPAPERLLPPQAAPRPKPPGRFWPLLAVTALVATSSALVARRAAVEWGAAEPPHAPSSTTQRWFSGQVVVTLDDSLGALGPDAEPALLAAFGVWQEAGAPVPDVRFAHGGGARPSLTPDGVNSVMVAPIDFEGHETDLAITIGFSHPKTGEITEADIVINSRHVFAVMNQPDQLAAHDAVGSDEAPATGPDLRPLSCLGNSDGAACGQTYDLQNVLTHEVGHFWGLPEDYEDRSSTMYSCTSACEVHKRRLGPADVRSLRELYGTSVSAGCGGAQLTRARPSAGHATALALGLGLTGLGWGAWRRRRARRAQPGTSTSAPRGGNRSSKD